MAATDIVKIIETLLFGHLSPDFDEIWYTNQKTHAEFEKRKGGCLTPFSKMAATAILEIYEQLHKGQT